MRAMEWCEGCEAFTMHVFHKGFPGNRYEPPEEGGVECLSCGLWTDPPEFNADAAYDDYREEA